MPPEIQRITEQFLSNPVRVEVSRPATAATTITQLLVASGSKDYEKRETLRRVLRNAQDLKNAIIFCNRKRDISVVVKSLEKHGFSVGGLHGDMDQRARMAMLDAFKAGRIPLLVASDVAARGLDIPDVSHVVNYDVPIHADDYVHRIGRTGRAGRTGTAYTIVSRADTKYIDAVTTLLKKDIPYDGTALADFVPESGDDAEERPRRSFEGRGRRGEGRAEGRRSRSGDDRPRREERPEREERPRRDATAEVHSESTASPRPPRPARPERVPAPSAPVAHPAQRGDDGPSVKGLGDHMPSFLMKPIRRKSA